MGIIDDALKQAIHRGDNEAILDLIADEYVEGQKDVYMARAYGNGNIARDSYLIDSVVNSQKNRDKLHFKNYVKGKIYDPAMATLQLLKEKIASKIENDGATINSFIKKVYGSHPEKMDADICDSKSYFELNDDEIRDIAAYGIQLIQADRLQDALNIFLFLSFLDPTNYDIWKNLGGIHLLLENNLEARRSFDRAIAIDPQCPIAYEGVFLTLPKEDRSMFKDLYPEDLEKKYFNN